MRFTRIRLLCMALALLISPVARANVLVDWDFSGLDYSSTLSLNDPAPNPVLPASSATIVPGISVSDLVPTPTMRVVVNANTMPGEADLRDFDRGGDGINDEYLEFSLTAEAPGTLEVDSLTISLWRNGAGAVDGMAFDVSVDGGEFRLYDSVQQDEVFGDFGFDTFEFGEVIPVEETITFRFAPRAVDGGSTGNLHINGLAVYGTLVPEPSFNACWGVILLCGLLSRRRRVGNVCK